MCAGRGSHHHHHHPDHLRHYQSAGAGWNWFGDVVRLTHITGLVSLGSGGPSVFSTLNSPRSRLLQDGGHNYSLRPRLLKMAASRGQSGGGSLAPAVVCVLSRHSTTGFSELSRGTATRLRTLQVITRQG